MRASVMERPGQLEVREFPEPRAGLGEVVVRMVRASLCGSDVHAVLHGFHAPQALGQPGFPGHEGVGFVVSDPGGTFPVGQPVLTIPTGNAGGCFAEYACLSADALVPLRAGDDMDQMVMAQQLGTVIFGVRKFLGGVAERGTATVIGCGSAGLFHIQLLRRAGFRSIVAADLNEYRLEWAERLGADEVVKVAPGELEPGDADVVAATMRATGGRGADLVVEAAGRDATRAQSIAAVRQNGVVGCFGYAESAADSPLPVLQAFRKAVRLDFVSQAQREPGRISFRAAINEIRDGVTDVGYLLGSRFELADIHDAVVRTGRASGPDLKLVTHLD